MRNFDDSRNKRRLSAEERTFVLGGETFTLRPAVHPSVLEGYDKIVPDTTVKDTLRIVDDLILDMIDSREEAHRRYRDVRDNRDDPVTIEDLQELVQWMVEVQTGRPTSPPVVSSSGPAPTETRSTEGSSSPVEKAA